MSDEILILLKKLISKYYEMETGEYIENFQEEIFLNFGDIALILKYRVLKHIVESRKRDDYTILDIFFVFENLLDILTNKNYKIVENKKEKNSLLLLEINFEKEKGLVVVLEIVKDKNGHFYIKTIFLRAVSKIKKLLK
jgi:hypothetical protein